MSARRAAVAATVLLLAVLGVLVWRLTPWDPLPGTVPGGPVAPDPSSAFTRAQVARSASFQAAVDPWSHAGLAVSLLVAVVLGVTPLGARLVRAVSPRRGWAWQVVIGGIVVGAVGTVATLPLAVRPHQVSRAYGLSTQGWGGWLADVGRSFAVNTGATVLVLLLLYLLLWRLPRWWWAPAAAGAFLFVVAGSYVYPLVVEPVFNKFTPMPPSELRASLLGLAARDHLHVTGVLVADASRRTTAYNAYVSGFGDTRRIVVYDTLLRNAPPAQVREVVAHELGHAKHDDVLHGTLLGAVAVAAAVCGIGWLAAGRRLPRLAGVSSARDPASLAAFLMLASLLSFAASPLQNVVSRHIEAHADAHALNLTRDPGAYIDMQRALAVRGLDDLRPSTFDYVFYDTHPTAPSRIAMGEDWARQHGVRIDR